MNELQNLLDVDMEYRLTIADRVRKDDALCAGYLIERRNVLLPEILRTAEEQGIDPVTHFSKFASKVHAKLCEK